LDFGKAKHAETARNNDFNEGRALNSFSSVPDLIDATSTERINVLDS